MLRTPIISGILAAILTPASIGLNHILSVPAVDPQDQKLSQSLNQLSSTLVSFESRQAGSEAELSKQLQSLASTVSQTQAASQSQIDALTRSLADVRQTALQAPDTSPFEQLLKDFGKEFESKVDSQIKTLVKAEVEEAAPAPKGVGTLDVNANPSDPALDSIQTMTDAARRIIALEKEVAALKARSTTSGSYPAASNVASGGSTGSYSGGYSQPVQNYQQQTPNYYSQPQQSSYSSQSYSSGGTCRRVMGRMICN